MKLPFITAALARRRARAELQLAVRNAYFAVLDENGRLNAELDELRRRAADVAEKGFAVLHRRSAIEDAVHTFVDVFDDGMLASMVGTAFTCAEVDAIAGVLLAAGREEAGVTWLECHAEGDEYGDAHNQGDELDEDDPQPTAVDIREYAHDLAA
ncbi:MULTISPECIES: hypothetical protein [unclassified Streptomyces]|uniref:hypothetical protein n=1 Tax=unclassified Streptomyces TaxID=2593676 RepID=UPI0003822CC7|nr:MULTISPECIES: hypothetical protein [unclassified Streptomyces]MYT31730.1 hypothetical protein [Streptomyces sp. SID8354]